ncbi:ABC transporter permease [Thalassotalea mangrovi]|uniref:FtsX-like permease family protein n=1 Tax=Thalassotalea mangrovi TaxID=2572245 RepID=A0A4U1B6F7_9GAMM|nr:FtsX-like permease family protein [Thalassotalea mangrovi]TKB46028.1 FtsX-like permease family protein [Thalassotalea mangrovi]
MNEIALIFRALLRNKVGAILISLQIALTLTIMVNAVFMMQERHAQMQRPSGLDEANLFYLSNTIFATDYNQEVALRDDLELLRNTPGVVDAIQINAIPLSGGGWSMGLQTEPGENQSSAGVAVYMVDDHAIHTLGLELLSGENFAETDIQWRESGTTRWPAKTIVTQAMAKELYPDDWQSALGKTVYISQTQPIQIIGIVRALQAPWNGWNGVERSMLVPYQMETSNSRYMIRTEPGRRDELMPIIEKALAQSNKGRIIRGLRTMEETRERSYRGHNAVNKILTTVVFTLTLITGFGIVGLAMFSINRRTKQIGTRRALGASRSQIMGYFLIENLMITTLGVVIGSAGAIGLNIWLVNTFTLSPINPVLVVIGIACIYLVGLLAVLYPARKAANISPAIATRTA